MTIMTGNTVGKQAGMVLEKKLRDLLCGQVGEKLLKPQPHPTLLQMTHLLQQDHTFSKEFHQLGTKSSNL